MKKIFNLLAIVGFSATLLVSCKNESKQTNDNPVAQNEHNGDHPPHDRKGPPPHGGDRKGPPQGGDHSPEQTKTLEEVGGYKIGDVATDFNLKNIDGSMVSLETFENAKGYIITFTCNECPFAKMYEDRLIELNDKYASQGYPVIAINANSTSDNSQENFDAMVERSKEKGFTYPYLVDEGQKIYPQYGAVRTPHVFLLDKDRKVQYIGTIDNNAKSPEDVTVKYVEDAIEALKKGDKPEVNYTKAIGCPVKPVRA